MGIFKGKRQAEGALSTLPPPVASTLLSGDRPDAPRLEAPEAQSAPEVRRPEAKPKAKAKVRTATKTVSQTARKTETKTARKTAARAAPSKHARVASLKEATTLVAAKPSTAKYGFVLDEQPVPVAARALQGGVLTTMEIRGKTNALLDAVDAYEIDHPLRPVGQIAHFCGGTATGIIVYDVWENQEALDAWLDKTPGHPDPRLIKLHSIRIGSA